MISFKKRAKFICLILVLLVALEITPCPPAALAMHSGTADMHGGIPLSNVTPQQPQPKTEVKDIPPNNPSADIQKLDPVYVDMGEFYYTHQDIFIPSRGLPIDITRVYRSQREFNARFGYGWFFNFYIQLKKLSNNNMLILDGSTARKIEFTYNSIAGSYTAPAGIYDTLVKNTDGTWTLTKKNGTKYNFDINGNLISIVDRNGNQISFTYDPQGKLPITGHSAYFVNLIEGVLAYDYMLTKITDSLGRVINFTYDSKGRLTTITDFSGRSCTYTYDTNDDLVSVTTPATTEYPLGLTTRYTYTQHNLETITDPKGQLYITNHYDSLDRVDWQTYGTGTAYITYDDVNKITTITDRKGFKTEWTYNTTGNPLSKKVYTTALRLTDPASYTTTYEYNSNMERTKEIFPEGNWIKYTYDSKGNLLELRRKKINAADIADPINDIVTTFTYETKYNFIKTLKDPKANTTTYYYDYEEATLGDLNGDVITTGAQGNLVKITYPTVGTQTSETKFTYNAYGQVETTTDPNGIVTKYEYYAAPDTQAGYLRKIIQDYGTDPANLNYTTEMTYDSVGNVKTIKDPKLNITTFEYDAHNNLIKTTSALPFSYVTNYKYDANDNLIQVDRETKDILNPWQTTSYTYDSLDRLLTITDELGNITTFSYDANGNRSSIKDAELNTTTYIYDERDLLWKVTDALGNITEYAYDKNANLKEIKDAKANKTTYTYDDFDRLTKTTYPDVSAEEYTYDTNSNLVTKKDPKVQVIYYDYDALNRLTEKGLSPKGTVPNSVVTYSYDSGSRLSSVTDTNGTIFYTYDNLNRITQVTTQGLTPQGTVPVNYEYDSNSNRTKLTYPDSSYITYIYDELNRLTSIKDSSGTNIASYTYDPLSRRTQLDYVNNTQTLYTYDAINRLTSINQGLSPQGTVPEFSYTYDNVGNRKSMTDLSGTHNYTYDTIYQLKTVDYPVGSSFADTTFNYDAVGNRTQTLNGGTTNYTSNNLNQYTTVGTTNYTHDANGNLTGDGTWTYAYDYENRLTSATDGTTTSTYKYDAFGRRIKKGLSPQGTVPDAVYIYDGDQLIAEYDNLGNLITKYIYGAGIDEPIKLEKGGQSYYYHFDGLGSVTSLTDLTGLTSETYTYDAFGKPSSVSTLDNRFMFTGREYDSETGLYYYRARYYSPALGRFLQRDQWPTPLTDPSSLVNRYLYCTNNPINWIDPFGWDKQKKDKPWWEKLREGYYYGTGFGQKLAEWSAQRQIETGNPLWAIPGTIASLWTPETYQKTGWTLIAAGSFVIKVNVTGVAEPTHVGFDILSKNIIHYGRHLKWGRHIGILFNKTGEALVHIYRDRIFINW